MSPPAPYLNGEMVDIQALNNRESRSDERFDPLGTEFVNDPWGHTEWSFNNEPVFYSHKLGYWVVTRYEDIIKIFKDTENYSASNSLKKAVPLSDEAKAVLDDYGYDFRDTIVNTDEPVHTPAVVHWRSHSRSSSFASSSLWPARPSTATSTSSSPTVRSTSTRISCTSPPDRRPAVHGCPG